jgi:acyl carrier protein
MERSLIYETVRKHTLRVVSECPPENFAEEKSILMIGGDSLDAVEVAAACAKELKIKLPRVKLMEVTDIKGLIDLLHESSQLPTTQPTEQRNLQL